MPPAARQSDEHTCSDVQSLSSLNGPVLLPCCVSVLIGNLTAARVSDLVSCRNSTDPIVAGEETVIIGNRPAARKGDPVQHGGYIATGDDTVLIGKDHSEVNCMIRASMDGSAFVV